MLRKSSQCEHDRVLNDRRSAIGALCAVKPKLVWIFSQASLTSCASSFDLAAFTSLHQRMVSALRSSQVSSTRRFASCSSTAHPAHCKRFSSTCNSAERVQRRLGSPPLVAARLRRALLVPAALAGQARAAMSGGQPKLEVDVWSDLACPWCWVGKRRLDKAIALLGKEADVEVRPGSAVDPAAALCTQSTPPLVPSAGALPCLHD